MPLPATKTIVSGRNQLTGLRHTRHNHCKDSNAVSTAKLQSCSAVQLKSHPLTILQALNLLGGQRGVLVPADRKRKGTRSRLSMAQLSLVAGAGLPPKQAQPERLCAGIMARRGLKDTQCLRQGGASGPIGSPTPFALTKGLPRYKHARI